MEVFAHITRVEVLPVEYMHLFYIRLMEYCMSAEAKDQEKNLLVRIVCVFLENQISQRVVHMNNELSFIMQKFCTKFNNVSEANTLSRQVATQNYMKQQETKKK